MIVSLKYEIKDKWEDLINNNIDYLKGRNISYGSYDPNNISYINLEGDKEYRDTKISIVRNSWCPFFIYTGDHELMDKFIEHHGFNITKGILRSFATKWGNSLNENKLSHDRTKEFEYILEGQRKYFNRYLQYGLCHFIVTKMFNRISPEDLIKGLGYKDKQRTISIVEPIFSKKTQSFKGYVLDYVPSVMH